MPGWTLNIEKNLEWPYAKKSIIYRAQIRDIMYSHVNSSFTIQRDLNQICEISHIMRKPALWPCEN